MDLPGYDAWKQYDPAEERAGKIDSLIDSEPEMQQLQRRVEMATGRVAALRVALSKAKGPRKGRIQAILSWAVRVEKCRKNALQAAIDHWDER